MIRPLRQSDTDALSRLNHPAGVIDRLQNSTRWGFGRTRQITLVWEDSTGHVLGSASAFAGAAPGLWSTGYVVIDRSARGAGIGTRLVHATAAAARAAGCHQAFCFIAPENGPSIRAHERVGYRRLPVARSILIPAPTNAAHDANGRMTIEPAAVAAQIRRVIDSGGVAPFADLSTATPLGALAPDRSRNALRMLLNLARGRDGERAYLVRSDGAEIGLLITKPGLYHLVLKPDVVAALSPERLSNLEAVARTPNTGVDFPGFGLVHGTLVAPTSPVTKAAHHVFALDTASQRDPPAAKQ